MQAFRDLPDHYKYGLAVFAAVFFAGWSTGLGGSFWPNLGFSILMGIFAGFLFRLIKRSLGDGK